MWESLWHNDSSIISHWNKVKCRPVFETFDFKHIITLLYRYSTNSYWHKHTLSLVSSEVVIFLDHKILHFDFSSFSVLCSPTILSVNSFAVTTFYLFRTFGILVLIELNRRSSKVTISSWINGRLDLAQSSTDCFLNGKDWATVNSERMSCTCTALSERELSRISGCKAASEMNEATESQLF